MWKKFAKWNETDSFNKKKTRKKKLEKTKDKKNKSIHFHPFTFCFT